MLRWTTVMLGGLMSLLVLVSSQDGGAAGPLQASAVLRNPGGEVVGKALLSEKFDGVQIQVQVSKLPPGVHGFHIHAVCRCEGPDFKSAGAHFNPDAKKHGFRNTMGPHAGDLPNLLVGEDGTASASFVAKGVTLLPGRYSIDGTALVIHAMADDYQTDPAGNAGDRIVCGCIAR